MTKPKFVKSSVDVNKDNGEVTFVAARNQKNLNQITYDTGSLLAQDATGEYSTLSTDWQDVAIPLIVF